MIFKRKSKDKTNEIIKNKIVFEDNYCKLYFNGKTISEENVSWTIDEEGTNEIINDSELLFKLRDNELEPSPDFQVFEWLRADGTYIMEGEPILFIQKGNPEIYKGVFKKVWLGLPIKSPATGYLQIDKQTGNEVKDGDLVFRIDTVKEEPADNENFQYLFNRFDIPENIRLGAKDVWHPHDKPIYISEWLIENGQYVKAETPILKIKCGSTVKTYFEYILPANKSGFVSFARFIPKEYPSIYGKIKQKEHLYTIFNAVEDKFYNKYKIETDDFSGDKSLIWEVIGGLDRPFNADNFSPIGGIHLNSMEGKDIFVAINNIKGLDYLVIYYFSNELKLQKSDKILFLFENGEIISFEFSTRGAKSVSSWKHLNEIKVPITIKELNAFANSKLNKWKIEKDKNDETITGDVGNSWYSAQDIQAIFQNMVTEYFEVLNTQFANYKPVSETVPNESPSKDETCFVYLMVDTTNNFYKIGISNKPLYREKTLQSEKPTIELICSKEFPSRTIAESIEKALHGAFASKRIRGEWFDLDAQEIYGIKKTLT